MEKNKTRIFLLAILSLSIFTSSFFLEKFMSRERFKKIEIASKYPESTIKYIHELEHTYGVSYVNGGVVSKKLKRLNLAFTFNKILSNDEAKSMILNISKTYLDRINNDTNLKPNLHHHPIDLKDLDIGILIPVADFSDETSNEFFNLKLINGVISYNKCSNSKGNLTYFQDIVSSNL